MKKNKKAAKNIESILNLFLLIFQPEFNFLIFTVTLKFHQIH